MLNTSHRAVWWHSCYKKKKYSTVDDAQKIIDDALRNSRVAPGELHIYRCANTLLAPHFHVGHTHEAPAVPTKGK